MAGSESQQAPGAPPQAWQVGKVEIPWQAGVFVFVEDGGAIQVRHGVEDQRADTIRLDRWQATELAWHLLRAAVGGKGWSVARPEELARLRVAIQRIEEIGDQEVREMLRMAFTEASPNNAEARPGKKPRGGRRWHRST